MEILKVILGALGAIGVIGAFIVPDWIVGVTKGMRMGRENYPKEKKLKKMKWFLIFFLPGCAAVAALYFIFYR